MQTLELRKALPGEPSLVVNFYYKLFEKQFNFFPSTEQYFLSAMTDFFDDPESNILYVIEGEGVILGSVCIIKIGEHEAQLRLFGISPSLQGQGYGRRLMQAAMDFCREKEYRHVILGTIDICQAARHLYSQFGFSLVGTKPNDTWAAYHMTEEKWEYRQDKK